jgi:signal transduction histidine kinase
VVLLLTGAGLIRLVTQTSVLRAEESKHLQQHLVLIADLTEDRRSEGKPVDAAYLERLVPLSSRLSYDDGSGAPVTAYGRDYERDNADHDLSVSMSDGDASLVLRQTDTVVRDLVAYDVGSLLVLFGMMAVLAAMFGYVVSRLLSAPFRQLADAAAALGRGRFALDLPRTRIPEARAIGQALESSAGQIQARLHRDQAFAAHASHELRTPLHRMRLELEELSLDESLSDDAREAVRRALEAADRINVVAGELVELNRRESLVEGAEIALRDLATQCAQHWADKLDDRGRTVTAGVEGALETTYTPGPVEHVLDLVLADVLRRSKGPVRLVFVGDPSGHLRVRVRCWHPKQEAGWPSGADRPDAKGRAGFLPQAKLVVEAMGGRMETHEDRGELELLLPRR